MPPVALCLLYHLPVDSEIFYNIEQCALSIAMKALDEWDAARIECFFVFFNILYDIDSRAEFYSGKQDTIVDIKRS